MLLISDAWPARTPCTRQRKPARPKPANPRKTVKPTPRGKYGLAPRKDLPLQLSGNEPASSSSSSSSRPSHVQFYQQLVAGTWPGLPSNQQPQRPRLFAAAKADTDTAKFTTGAAGVCRKLQPTLHTTQRWTRLQRKVLPKYLLALDDATSVLLLKCLARLQPPLAAATAACSEQRPTGPSSMGLALLPEQLQQGEMRRPQQQQAQPQYAQLTAAAIPSSINGAIRHRFYAAAMGAAAAYSVADDGPGGSPAADVAAVARGFASAGDERAQFDLMLAGVCAALQQKLPAWGGRRLVEALCWLSQLHSYHEGFLQAWFAATEPHLQQLPMSYLASCCEALASLAAPVPSSWLQAYAAATEARLGQLSLQQLATLLMHVADLQLQLPGGWWQEYSCCLLRRANRKLAADTAGARLSFAGTAGLGEQDVEQQQQHAEQQLQQHAEQQLQQRQLLEPQASRIRAAADAVCSVLWACSRLPGQPLQQQCLQSCLALLLPAVGARHCSAGAAVQLLHACCAGACRTLPAASSAVQTCLICLQDCLQKVCTDLNTLQLLLACMPLRSVQQLPPSFSADLEAALVPLLPSLPPHVLVEVAATFGAVGHSPGLQFMSSFALLTRQKLASMGPAQAMVLVDSCLHMRSMMPSSWVVAVLQQLQQYVETRRDVVGSGSRNGAAVGPGDAAADVDAVGLSPGEMREVLHQLEQVAADWPGVCAGTQGAIHVLQHYVRVAV